MVVSCDTSFVILWFFRKEKSSVQQHQKTSNCIAVFSLQAQH